MSKGSMQIKVEPSAVSVFSTLYFVVMENKQGELEYRVIEQASEKRGGQIEHAFSDVEEAFDELHRLAASEAIDQLNESMAKLKAKLEGKLNPKQDVVECENT